MRLLHSGRFAFLATFLTLASLCLTKAQADGEPKKNTKYPQCILIIRHAEKTGDKDDIHLAKQGKERAEVLDQLFVASKERTDSFPTPDFIFAATAHKDSQRPVETVTPLAKKLKLTINDKFDNKLPKEGKEKTPGAAELRDELFNTPKYYGKTILISWRHSTLPQLATTLKAEKVPEKWDDNVFDRVWQINYDNEGKATFRDRPQRLLPKDSEK
jgi:broad specificity phosphatase PhoE